MSIIKKNIIDEKNKYMKDKSSNSTLLLINCYDDDIDNDQCDSSEICKSMLFNRLL